MLGVGLEYLDWQEDCIYFQALCQPHKMEGVANLKGNIKILD